MEISSFDSESSDSSATVTVSTELDSDFPIESSEKSILEPFKESWQNKFCLDDFCDNSNELADIIGRFSESKPGERICRPIDGGTGNVRSFVEGSLKSRLECNDTDSDCDILKKLQNKYGSTSSTEKCTVVENLEEKHLSCINLDNRTETTSKGSKRKKESSEADKIDKKQIKDAKKKEREFKKIKSEQEKAAKNALKLIEKSVKPDECLKYITVNLDNNILNKEYCPVIRSALENGGYNFKFVQLSSPNIILWTRTVQSFENLEVKSDTQNEKYCLLILDSKEFIGHVHNKTFVGHIKSLLNLFDSVQLSLAIFGLEKYYNYLKNCRKKEFRAEVAEKNSGNNSYKVYSDWPKVEKTEIEMTLIDLQIFCKNCYIRYIEKYEELAYFVMESTKAVAQIPYKSIKQQKYEQENEFFSGDNRNCVGVDKNGNGLGRLWSQILTLFPLASLEVAEAITSVYSTPQSLISAYKNCQTSEEKEKLLQDIPIRRAAGHLSAIRRIGPELSKKVYLFFCSEENILL